MDRATSPHTQSIIALHIVIELDVECIHEVRSWEPPVRQTWDILDPKSGRLDFQ